MAPMSGNAELTPTGQTGVYKVTSKLRNEWSLALHPLLERVIRPGPHNLQQQREVGT